MKKILALLLILITVFSFVACGDEDTAVEDGEKSQVGAKGEIQLPGSQETGTGSGSGIELPPVSVGDMNLGN